MHIVLISGSHRPNAQSGRIARHLAAHIPRLKEGVTSDVIDLGGNPLPLWDESARKSDSPLGQQWKPYSEKLRAADGLVVISPEWHGMVPAGLKNFFLFANADEIGHKPALIVGVSASRGGAFPVAELRESSYKNSRILYIPEHLIVRNAEKMFVGETPSDDEDKFIRARADYDLNILFAYADALKPVRDSGVTSTKIYKNGM